MTAPPQYRALNRPFHHVVSENINTSVNSRLWDLSDLIINTVGVERPLATATQSRYEDHEQVIDAIQAKDVEGAREAMNSHIVGTVAIINAEGVSLPRNDRLADEPIWRLSAG